MKTRPLYIIIILTFLTLACSKDDDDTHLLNEESQVIESFHPISIKFVYEDGKVIGPDDCIVPNVAYAVQIETTKNNKGNTQVSKVDYTINGTLFSMSFSQAGIKRIPVLLVDGKNIAELVKTAINIEVRYTVQEDFQLVN